MMLIAIAGMVLSASAAQVPAADLPSWTFATDLQGWAPNSHLANVAVKDGALCADAVDWDPFLTMTGLNIEAKPWQYVVATLKADKPGQGELFWSGETAGQYGGFSGDKRTPFTVAGDNVLHDIVIFPFWQTEGTIRQLRFDVYNGAHFEIKAIRVLQWGADAPPQDKLFTWTFNGDTAAWQVHPGAAELWAPPLNLAVKDKGWVVATLKSDTDAPATILWSVANGRGVQTADFVLQPQPEPKTYNIEMTGIPDWHDGVAAFGIRIPKQGVRLDSITISDKPLGPPDVVVTYFGFENALNRTSRPCRVIAQVANRGGAKAENITARMVLSPDLRFSACPPEQVINALSYGETKTVGWNIVTQLASTQKAFFRVGTGKTIETSLEFTKNLLLEKADYVPRPNPVKTDVTLCAYYFPGWDADTKWDCIRRLAPIRKPALGYYDESNPECVDWQIKWAVENGISCFLVDWYWTQGSQSLTHWFDAYRKARYKDMLKVAIMWANHNPPDTHSAEDWRKVTQEWIDHYFNLPGYFRIEDKPAVFIWAPDNVRRDLKGSDGVKAALAESQEMAKKAGYGGITFVAMGSNFAASSIQTLLNEGYAGSTEYHEWGPEAGPAMAIKRMKYETVVKSSPQTWDQKDKAAGALTYYPVVDTGWDSRPWHGDKAFVIEGRTPALFEQLLTSALDFANTHKKKIVVLGPLNEWGEGSYIEPNLEFGFTMYEAVRGVFGQGNPKRWPANIGPGDLGRGPFDYPSHAPVTSWSFDGPESGWKPMMGVADLAYKDGRLHLRTTSADPALTADTYGIQAADISKAIITMQLTGQVPNGTAGQFYWATDAGAITEETSIRFPLLTDGEPHTYVLDLKSNSRWRNRITALRFDPCETKDLEVILESIELKP